MKPRKMTRTQRDILKAAKQAAREDFGFMPTRVSANRKKYSRSAEKRAIRKELNY